MSFSTLDKVLLIGAQVCSLSREQAWPQSSPRMSTQAVSTRTHALGLSIQTSSASVWTLPTTTRMGQIRGTSPCLYFPTHQLQRPSLDSITSRSASKCSSKPSRCPSSSRRQASTRRTSPLPRTVSVVPSTIATWS